MIRLIDCANCGKQVKLECQDSASETTKRILASLTEVLCASCEEVAERERRAEEAQRAAEDRRRKYLQRVERSLMPRALVGLNWGALDEDGRKRTLESAHEWATGGVRGLVLFGEVGVGKTRIAATAANEMLRHRTLLWTSAPALFAKLGTGHNDRARQLAADLLNGTEALVLDDMDKARPTAFGAETVFAVIDGRITAGAPLLITSNLSPVELADKFPEPYGDALASRLAGYCRVHELKGADRRLVAA